MSSPSSARALVLTGPGLSLIVFALLALALNRLHNNDLERSRRLGSEVARSLEAAPAEGRFEHTSPSTTFEDALLEMPHAVLVDALPFYDESERAEFARSRWVGDPPSGQRGPLLAPPYGMAARYEAGAVSIHWACDPATLALVDELPAGQRLAFHVDRIEPGSPGRRVAELKADARVARDADLPLGQTLVGYQVWAVILNADGQPVAAEAGDLVSLTVPERFRLALIAGDVDAARIRVEIGPEGRPVSARELDLEPGAALIVDGRPTGLTLQTLEVVPNERLETRRRLAFRSDGTLVLDPNTRTPRTSETQVLVPVTRLVATLTDSTGAPRTLELDLP
ncbi:MAG: hypothetical protein DRQ55_02405 [Planctomycetota bacterium]|nr:MAG: hypothetical protein DRQ55_02405 [Planctomycetota bacterium]